MTASAAEELFEDRLASCSKLASYDPPPGMAVVVDLRRYLEAGADPEGKEADSPLDGADPGAAESLHPAVAALRGVCQDRAAIDASLVTSAVGIVDHCRPLVLDRRGWTGIELSKTQERSWAADVKRAAITEVQAGAGFTVTEATSLITLAMARSDLIAVVSGALIRGETSWAQVRRFVDAAFSAARKLTADQQLLIALSLFGTDESLAAPERLDPDGTLPAGVPWPHARYEAALAREVAACEGSDVAAERAKRARAYQQRRAWVRVHDDGTATMSVRGPAVPIVGIWARFDKTARNLRAGGSEYTLDQLVVDSMLTVLAHGKIELPEAGDLAELPADQLDDLIAVVNGMPRMALQVIVPVDVLGVGHPICATCASDINAPSQASDAPDADQGPTTSEDCDADGGDASGDTDGDDTGSDPHCFPGRFGPPGPPPAWAGEPQGGERGRDGQSRSDGRHGDGPGVQDPPDEGRRRDDPEDGPDGGLPSTGSDSALRHGRGMVGEILGSHNFFITPGQARELFYTPRTTLHRLLTRKADGRIVERTIRGYRPDPDMRRQVHAADVYSRAPWTRLTGRSVEIDHVVPYDLKDPEAGGQTGELNLADQDKRTHKTKTLNLLRIEINERRDLTFTTLLGQITRSRTHDYGQYLTSIHPDDLDERRDLANQAVYAVLAARPEARRRPGKDAWISVDHTGPDGERRPGPPPDVPDLRGLLKMPDDTE